jgi:Flp pilus assembly protein TadG
VGIIEFGRAYQTWQVLTNAAREGARVAVLPNTDNAAVLGRIEDYLEAGQLAAPESAEVTITRDTVIPIGTGTATASSIQVDYPFQFMVLQPVAQLVSTGSSVGAPIMMRATATMRNE